MALELIHDAPTVSQYTSLAEHQAQTPGTFFGGKPVLYYHISNAILSMDSHQLSSSAAFSSLRSSSIDTNDGASSNTPTNGDATHAPIQEEIPSLQIFVASDYFTLFSPSASRGLHIPYPTISLHAQQSNALYMQLCLSDISQTADEDLETLELLLTPVPSTTATDEESSAQALYAAVSACADLHPDPDSSEDGEEEDMDTAPGAGGWITSENMADFTDADGNFVMPEGGLGAGAGSVRTAEQFEDAEENGADGEESKWRRTD